jgi:hypothetical protein
MTGIDALFIEFRQAYEAGRNPDPLAYLDRAGTDRDELAAALDVYLELNPPPPPSAAELEAMASDASLDPPTWSRLLVEERTRRGLLRRTVVERLTAALGLSAAAEPRVALRLHELEAGTRSPVGVSERVVDALDQVLGPIAERLRQTRGLGTPLAAPAGATFRRGPGDVEPERSTAPAAPGSEDAEVDRLFGAAA